MGGPKETGHTSQDVVRNGLRWALASAQSLDQCYRAPSRRGTPYLPVILLTLLTPLVNAHACCFAEATLGEDDCHSQGIFPDAHHRRHILAVGGPHVSLQQDQLSYVCIGKYSSSSTILCIPSTWTSKSDLITSTRSQTTAKARSSTDTNPPCPITSFLPHHGHRK
jgi:hypothetical protein